MFSLRVSQCHGELPCLLIYSGLDAALGLRVKRVLRVAYIPRVFLLSAGATNRRRTYLMPGYLTCPIKRIRIGRLCVTPITAVYRAPVSLAILSVKIREVVTKVQSRSGFDRSRKYTEAISYPGQSTLSSDARSGSRDSSRGSYPAPLDHSLRLSRPPVVARLHSRSSSSRSSNFLARTRIDRISGGFLLLRTCRGAPIRRSCRRNESLGLALRRDLRPAQSN